MKSNATLTAVALAVACLSWFGFGMLLWRMEQLEQQADRAAADRHRLENKLSITTGSRAANEKYVRLQVQHVESLYDAMQRDAKRLTAKMDALIGVVNQLDPTTFDRHEINLSRVSLLERNLAAVYDAVEKLSPGIVGIDAARFDKADESWYDNFINNPVEQQ